MEQQPTHGQILAWLSEIAGDEHELDKAAKLEEDLYFQAYDLQVPEGHSVVRLGTAPGDVDQALETAAPGDTIGVEVRPAKDTADWQHRADQREKWIRALLNLWRQPDDFVRQLLWGIIVQRKRWLFVGYNPPDIGTMPTAYADESWDSYDQRVKEWQDAQDGWVPVSMEIKPRGSVFGRETSNGKLLYCFEQFNRTIADLYYWYPPDRFPAVARLTKGRSYNDYVTFTAFWSNDWRSAYVDLQPILPSATGTHRDARGIVRNEYGFIPFIPCYFRKLPVPEPERAYRGFLSNAVDDYKAESLLASQYLTVIARAAWPVVLTRFLDNRKFNQQPGWQFPLRPGEAVEAFNGQAPLPEVGQAWDRIRAAIRQNALGASAGNMPPGVRSAEALSMMQGPDRNKIAPALRSLQIALEQAVTMALKIIEHIYQKSVTLPLASAGAKQGAGRSLQVVTLKPEDIRGYYDCQVSFGPAFGMDVLNRAQALNALVKDHFISRERAWRNVPELVESQEDAFEELIEEAADNHPLMVQAHVMKRLSTYDPQIFGWMMEVGAFNGPSAGGGGGKPPGDHGGGGSQSGPSGPPPAAGRPGPSPAGQPMGQPGGAQVGQAIPGGNPVRPMVP